MKGSTVGRKLFRDTDAAIVLDFGCWFYIPCLKSIYQIFIASTRRRSQTMLQVNVGRVLFMFHMLGKN